MSRRVDEASPGGEAPALRVRRAGISTQPRRGLTAAIRRVPAQAGVALVYAYRGTLGLFVPEGTCKYYPSCSQYAIDALRKHGLVKGSVMTCWRLLRCNPWSHGGVDHP